MRQRHAKPRGAREDVILFTVSGNKFAIAANAVSEIRNLDGLHRSKSHSASGSSDKVEITFERDGVNYSVIDAARYFKVPGSSPSRLLVLRHAPVGVLVGSTDRITEISVLHALPSAFTGEERRWYRGLAIVNGEVAPVVNPAMFLETEENTFIKTAARPIGKMTAV